MKESLDIIKQVIAKNRKRDFRIIKEEYDKVNGENHYIGIIAQEVKN